MPEAILAEGHALALEGLDEEAQTVEVLWYALVRRNCLLIALLSRVRQLSCAIHLVNVGEQAKEGRVEGHSMPNFVG